MIRTDPPDGWPGTGGHGAGWVAAELTPAVAAPTAPAGASWHTASATAATAAYRRPRCAVPKCSNPDRLIVTSGSIMAIANAPTAARAADHYFPRRVPDLAGNLPGQVQLP